MNCHATRAVLDLHAEGRLAPRRDAAVASHLSSCEACRAMAAPSSAAPAAEASAALKSRLSAALKSQRAPAPLPRPSLELTLWPRELSGVALAAAALALIALVIGWSGAPSQGYQDRDEIAFGRTR